MLTDVDRRKRFHFVADGRWTNPEPMVSWFSPSPLVASLLLYWRVCVHLKLLDRNLIRGSRGAKG